jgi:hypothetical protein
MKLFFTVLFFILSYGCFGQVEMEPIAEYPYELKENIREYTHVINNENITMALCLSDGKFGVLSLGTQVELVGRYSDNHNEFVIIKRETDDEYYLFSTYSKSNESISLKIKIDPNEDVQNLTQQEITLLKDSLREDHQNQDFIIPIGKKICLLNRGMGYSKISVQQAHHSYIGFVRTSYINTTNHQCIGNHRQSDSRDKFDILSLTNKKIVGKYQIEATINGGEKIYSEIEIQYVGGLLKYRRLKEKKYRDGKEIYHDIFDNNDPEGFIFFNKESDSFRFRHPQIDIVEFNFDGKNSSQNNYGWSYAIKKTL